MGIARIEIAYHWLIELLKLPEGTDIKMTVDGDRVLTLVVSHPDLPVVGGGEPFPLLNPVFESTSVVTRMLSWEPSGVEGT